MDYANLRMACFHMFCRRYCERIKTLKLKPYPVPEEILRDIHPAARSLLPYLLADKEFYQGRVHALASLSDYCYEQPFHLGRILWEMEGMEPGDFIDHCNSIKQPGSRFQILYKDQVESWLKHRKSQSHQEGSQSEDHESIQEHESIPRHDGIRSNEQYSLRDFENFMQQWPDDRSSWIYKAIRDSMPGLKEVLRTYQLTHVWDIGLSRLGDHYPLELGLLVCVRLCWPVMASWYMRQSISILNHSTEPCTTPVETSLLSRILSEVMYDPDEEKEVPSAVHILFSAAGSGKTRNVFDLLSQKWGFYILPPNLEPLTAELEKGSGRDSDLLDPQRMFGSRDTYTLFLDCPVITKTSAITRATRSSSNLCEHVLISRFVLFLMFLLQCPNPSPIKWLLVQISCSDLDPFDALSRLFRLAQDEVLGCLDMHYEKECGSIVAWMQICVQKIRAWGDPRFFDGHIYFCIDEAQTVLADEQASRIFDSMYEAVMGIYTCTMAEHYGPTYDGEDSSGDSLEAEAQSEDPGDDNLDSAMSEGGIPGPGYSVVDPILIFSGTSMNIDKMKVAIDEALVGAFGDDWNEGNLPPKKWQMYRVHNNFPLVADDESFWRLYRHHSAQILSETMAMTRSGDGSPQSRPLLSRSGRPLGLHQIEADGRSPEEYLRSKTWLWRPLETASLSRVIDLLCQIGALTRLETEPPSVSEIRRDSDGLEDVLDQKDPFLVKRWMKFVAHRLCAKHSDGPNKLILDLLSMLAEYGRMSLDAVTELIEGDSQTRFNESNLSDLADELFEQLRDIYVRQTITTNSKVLRGRYRWSTIYIEALITEAIEHGSCSPPLAAIRNIVEQASRSTESRAIKGLQRQIYRMIDQGKPELVQDLYRAGIRAEVLGRPTIFLDPSYAELVTYGFALVESCGKGDMKYKIAEPLAVHAIMDHLRGKGEAQYQQLMLQSLIHTQDDHEVQAMFGKAAEWYIAASFDRLLRPPRGDDLLAGPPRHRQALLDLFAQSRTCNTRDSRGVLLKSLVRVEDFGLAPSPTEYHYQPHRTIWDWMKQYRTQGPSSTSTFLLPDQYAGPDLLFVLETNLRSHGANQVDQVSRILVAVQVKTGRASFENAMDSLLVSRWYQSCSSASAHSSEFQFDFWQNVPVLLVLVSTGQELNRKRIDKWLSSNQHRSEASHFFCFIDEAAADDVWGFSFSSIAMAIKERERTEKKQGRKRKLDN